MKNYGMEHCALRLCTVMMDVSVISLLQNRKASKTYVYDKMDLRLFLAMLKWGYRKQYINLQSKSMEWFLYDRDLCHARVKPTA